MLSSARRPTDGDYLRLAQAPAGVSWPRRKRRDNFDALEIAVDSNYLASTALRATGAESLGFSYPSSPSAGITYMVAVEVNVTFSLNEDSWSQWPTMTALMRVDTWDSQHGPCIRQHGSMQVSCRVLYMHPGSG